jgi:hypothetical protein
MSVKAKEFDLKSANQWFVLEHLKQAYFRDGAKMS